MRCHAAKMVDLMKGSRHIPAQAVPVGTHPSYQTLIARGRGQWSELSQGRCELVQSPYLILFND